MTFYRILAAVNAIVWWAAWLIFGVLVGWQDAGTTVMAMLAVAWTFVAVSLTRWRRVRE